MMASSPPSNVGERLLPSLVDEIARTDPHRVIYSITKTKNPQDGFQDITAKALARSVDRCSWYIEKSLGRGQDFPTLCYMGPQDVVYAILVLACIKTGYKLLLPSPRNALEAHLYLLEKTDCNTFLMPPNFPLPVVKQILEGRQMRVLEIAGLQHWLADAPESESVDKPYPYSKTFAEAKYEPFAVLHTSGSTGMPKPIIQTHATMAPMDAFTALPSLGQKPTYPAMCGGTRVYLTFPLFHCAGIAMILPGTIYSGFTTVLAAFPPSADTVNGVHVHGNVQHSCVAPTTLIDLVKDPEHLENLGKVKQITFGGGPCPQAVGDLISTKTRLLNCLGTTECAVLPLQLCDPEDWAYMSVSPYLGHEYRRVSGEGDLYEQVIVRDPKLHLYQGVFGTFPELDEYPTKDLYAKHPTKENCWLYKGRADDIIVYSTGEKLNPLEMESIISANPAVSAALVTGFGKFQSSLLVEPLEPIKNEAEKEQLMTAIWPSVQAANKEGPSHARIHRDMIAFTSPDRPMLRAGKGTIQRKMTVDMYAAELDALYVANGDDEGPEDELAEDGLNGLENIQDAVKHIVTAATDIDVQGLAPDADLFELGLNSLQVMAIAKALNKSLLSKRKGGKRMDARAVYSNPSIAALTAATSARAEGKTSTESHQTNEQHMERLYNTHTAKLPLPRTAEPKIADSEVVLVTGSTGSLGSYVLDSLISDARVSRIYCLNRGPRSLERQQKSQEAKGLQPLSSKVESLDADLSKPSFGLSEEVFNTLLRSVTTVIHNAWQVDFNLSIESFATQIGAVRRFVDFSAESDFGAQLFFVSSISAVSSWRPPAGSPEGVPEQIYEDWGVPEPMGYGQSKFVSERLLDAAAREAGVPAIVCRVGQIAGPTTSAGGMWPKQEWLPSLVASSKYLRKLPTSLGQMQQVDWIPVDVLANIVVELSIGSPASARRRGAADVYHAVNPRRAAWADLVPTVARHLDPAGGIELVYLEAWVEALRASPRTVEDVAQNPAIRILDFFEGLVAESSADAILLSTTGTVTASETLANLGPIHDGLMENWLRQWAF